MPTTRMVEATMNLCHAHRCPLRLLTVLGCVLSTACGAAPEPVATRLVDLFRSEVVSGSPAPTEPPRRTEWRFDGPTVAQGEFADTGGFEAGPGVPRPGNPRRASGWEDDDRPSGAQSRAPGGASTSGTNSTR